MLIKETTDMTKSERIAIANTNNQYLRQLCVMPMGVMYHFAGNIVPKGYLICDGRTLDKTEYAELYSAIGNTYGGAGETFNLPNIPDHIIKAYDTDINDGYGYIDTVCTELKNIFDSEVQRIDDSLEGVGHTLAQRSIYAHQNFANALKSTASGATVTLKDVSPLEHEVKVKATLDSINFVKGDVATTYNAVVLVEVPEYTPLNHTLEGDKDFDPNSGHESIILSAEYQKGFRSNVPSFEGASIGAVLTDGNNYYTLYLVGSVGGDVSCAIAGTKVYLSVDDGELEIYDVPENTVFHCISCYGMEFKDSALALYTCSMPGITDIRLSVGGKNLFDLEALIGKIENKEGSVNSDINYYVVEMPFKPNTQYYLKCNGKRSGDTLLVSTKYKVNTLKSGISINDGSWPSEKAITTDETGNIYFGTVGGKVPTASAVRAQLEAAMLQIEEGATATEYEPYVEPKVYTPEADGTVKGVMSIYPSMRFETNNSDVWLDIEYNRDIVKALASGGGGGLGISSVQINNKGALVLTYTDGTSKNLGVVVGANGKDGVDGTDGEDGKDGANGQDGYTPVKGTDYWTDDDKAEIVEEVKSETGEVNNKLCSFIQNTDVDYAFDSATNANYTIIRVYKNRIDGTKQYPFVYAPNGVGSGTMTTYDLATTEGWLLAINAGVFDTSDCTPDGIVIQNGSVIQNGQTITHSQCKPLTIDGDGNLGYADYNADADTLVSEGIVSAVTGFIPIILNYQPVSESEWNNVTHYKENAQRQIIGQFGNGDYAIITCEGRSYDNSDGWTIAEAQAVCQKHGLKFAYNLDGGGSTETMLGKKHINTIYENTTGRKVPTFIVFNGTSVFDGKESNGSASVLPEGYTELTYVSAPNGGVYIDTGIPATADYDAEYKARHCAAHILSAENYYYPFFKEIGTDNRGLLTNRFGTDKLIEYTFSYNNVYTINVTGETITVDDVVVTTENIKGSSEPTGNLYMFAYGGSPENATYQFTAELYYFKLFDKTTGDIVYDFVPCKNPDGIAGLYETVNKRFYHSDSGTELTGG